MMLRVNPLRFLSRNFESSGRPIDVTRDKSEKSEQALVND